MKKLIVGNLKMNLITTVERERYFESFKKELKGKKFTDLSIVLCPPAVHIESFAKKLKTKAVSIGAQNIFWEDKGSYTGEISASMVKNLGGDFAIIGHSERRKYLHETSLEANAKIKSALKNKLSPIYCVGETLEERKNGNVAMVVTEQVKEGLSGISSSDMLSVVIAYEPVWSIGSGAVPSSDEILEVRILIKRILVDIYGLDTAEKIKILYGGSVKSSIVKQTCIDPKMDGVLVGRESLAPREFIKIVQNINANGHE